MTTRDVDAVVDVHLAAFPTFFLSSLGGGFLKQFYRAIVDLPDGVALVAVVGGRVAGFAAGTLRPRAFYRRLLFRRSVPIGLTLVSMIIRHPSLLFKVARRCLQRTAGEAVPAGAELMSLAVLPGDQRSGVGRLLIDEFTARVRARNQSAVWLTTDAVGNDRVQRFYEAAGFAKRRSFTNAEGRQLDEYQRVF